MQTQPRWTPLAIVALDAAGGLDSYLLATYTQTTAPVAPALLTAGDQPAATLDAALWLAQSALDAGAPHVDLRAGAARVRLMRADRAPREQVYATLAAWAAAPSADRAARAALALVQQTPGEIGYLSAANTADERTALLAAYADAALTVALDGAPTATADAAADLDRLMRAVLALHARFLPATPEALAGWGGAFYAVAKAKGWLTGAQRPTRSAAFSVRTASGWAHGVLTDASADRPRSRVLLRDGTAYLLPIAAHTQAALLDALAELDRAADQPLAALARRCYAAYAAQPDAPYALALVAHHADDLRAQIALARAGVPAAFASGHEWHTPRGSSFAPRPVGQTGTIAFVYPGAFNSYPKMGLDLFPLFPDLYDDFHALTSDVSASFADAWVAPRRAQPLSRKSWQSARAEFESRPVEMMESGTALSILLTRIMREVFALQPSTAFGYSLGEGTMFWALGAWTDGDASRAAMQASPLFIERLAGTMGAVREVWGVPVDLPTEQVWAAYFLSVDASLVADAVAREARVYLTHINTPHEVMIAGDPAACERVIAALGVQAMRAPFDVVIHCEAVIPEYGEFVRLHTRPTRPIDGVTFYSAADYAPTRVESHVIAHNIARVACRTVDFPRLIERAYADGARVFVELGPRSTCARWIDETLTDRDHVAVSLNVLGADDRTALLHALARLISHRVPLNLAPLYHDSAAQPDTRTSVVPAAHAAYLSARAAQLRSLGEQIAAQFAAASRGETPIPPTPVGTTPALSAAPVLSARAASPLQPALSAPTALSASSVPVAATARPPVWAVAPTSAPAYSPATARPLYTRRDIEEFATGSIPACFGERYAVYADKRAPRIPNGDLLLISRIVSIEGERYRSEPGTRIVAEYDVPPDMWFYRDNVSAVMPCSVYMEIALQPCGFLSAYHGPTLAFPDIDFYFRNLDGQATLTRPFDLRGRTITNRVTMLNSTVMQGIIIQKFDFELSVDGDVFYTGDASFGYFSPEALANQAGLDRGQPSQPWYVREAIAAQPRLLAPAGEGQAFFAGTPAAPHYRLPHGQVSFLDEALFIPNAGQYGKGYAYGVNNVDASDWFFANHFYQDPVMPGSLGVETIMQTLQAYALEHDLGAGLRSPYFTLAADHHTLWRYRGQVVSRDNRRVRVEAHIKDIVPRGDQRVITADASLWRDDGLRIYEVKDAAIALADASA